MRITTLLLLFSYFLIVSSFKLKFRYDDEHSNPRLTVKVEMWPLENPSKVETWDLRLREENPRDFPNLKDGWYKIKIPTAQRNFYFTSRRETYLFTNGEFIGYF